MNALRATLVSDGSTDQMLIPLLGWLLREHHSALAVDVKWADLDTRRPKTSKLGQRIQVSLDLFPCDILFIHRDAEHDRPTVRLREIDDALNDVRKAISFTGHYVHIIPVRMTEAWLLCDEPAIRAAAERPNAKPLKLPLLKTLESLPDPKETLFDLLKQASGATGRKAKKFRPHERAYRVAELITDYSPLRVLPAFRALEAEIQALPL